MLEIIFIAFVLFFAVVLHECAHGWVAYKLGDPTAKLAGRLTLNPLVHIDPVGTLFVPGFLIALRLLGLNTFLIGWAKPIPVDFRRLNNPKTDIIWVGLAGPCVNILLAIAFSQALHFPVFAHWHELIAVAVFINLLLAVFNMIPVPPLDGSRLVVGILPESLAIPYSRLEPYGILIVIVLISLGVLDTVVFPIIEWAGRLLGIEFQ